MSMKSKRRKFGLVSKVKHTVSNKKHEWDLERQENKAMKAKADEIGKQRAKAAKKRQLERDAEDRYRSKFGVRTTSQPNQRHSSKTTKKRKKGKRVSPPRPPSTKMVKEYDPFGWQDL